MRHAVGVISKYGRLSQTAGNADPGSALLLRQEPNEMTAAVQAKKAKQNRRDRNDEENSPPMINKKEQNKYIESLNSMDFEKNNVDRSVNNSNLKIRNEYKNNGIDKRHNKSNNTINTINNNDNNDDNDGNDGDDGHSDGDSDGDNDVTPIEERTQRHGIFTGNKADLSRLDALSQFSHLSTTINSIAEKLTGDKARKPFASQSHSQSVSQLSGQYVTQTQRSSSQSAPPRGDRAGPAGFMGDSDGYADYQRYERSQDTRTPSFLHENEVENADKHDSHHADNNFRRSYSADMNYVPEVFDVTDVDWKARSSKYSSYSKYDDNDHEKQEKSNNMFNNVHNFEDTNLRLSVDNASEHASGLLLAAAKYGIFN